MAKAPDKRSAVVDPVAPADLQDYFSYKISRLSAQVSMATARAIAARHDLTLRDWRILYVVRHRQPIAPIAIAEAAHFDRAQVSRALVRLEERGLIDRALEAGAGKRTAVRLTAAGRALFAAIMPAARQRETALLAVLTPTERVTLDGLLDRLLERSATL